MPEQVDSAAVNYAVLAERLANISKRVEDLEKEKLDKSEHEPVRILVYGLVGLILVAVIGALIKLVIV